MPACSTLTTSFQLILHLPAQLTSYSISAVLCLHFPVLCCVYLVSHSLFFHSGSASLILNWTSHKWEIRHDYFDPCMFYFTHLLARISTHHCMLNSIKGNAIVIKGLVSQLLLAQISCALNQNRWRTSEARLNTHTVPKGSLANHFLFFIYFLSTWARGMGILCQSVYWSWAWSSRVPACLNIEHTWTNTGTAVFHYVKCR